jgi:ABC-type transporter Mla MlaB component
MPTKQRSAMTFAIRGPLAPSDLPGLCARVGAQLERCGSAFASCEVTGVHADAVAVDALARLQLAAHRYGCRIRLHGASEELRDLVAFMGLRNVLPG